MFLHRVWVRVPDWKPQGKTTLMVLNKRGDVKRKKGFHRIHRRVEGQLRLEIDKRQQGSRLACYPQKGYRAPLHPLFTVSFLNLDPVSTAGRGLARSQWFPQAPPRKDHGSSLLTEPPDLSRWPFSGWGHDPEWDVGTECNPFPRGFISLWLPLWFSFLPLPDPLRLLFRPWSWKWSRFLSLLSFK